MMFKIPDLISLFALFIGVNAGFNTSGLFMNRNLGENGCDKDVSRNILMRRYFEGMNAIYGGSGVDNTCYPTHKSCGWPSGGQNKLPLFVLSIGLEGAGHHLWTEIMEKPVFDCVWTNARHYYRDIADGVPRASAEQLRSGLAEQLKLRKDSGMAPCRSIYDAEDSFPTGAIRKSGRIFMRPDILNLQKLDGVMFDVKYLIIVRNVTDTALSALRRNFYSTLDQELRTVEHTLTYIESVMRGIPCNKIFIAHYEHVLAEPQAFFEPLSLFLNLEGKQKEALKSRLSKKGKLPSRKAHKLTQFKECSSLNLNEQDCYAKISKILDEFLIDRGFMWPTFAANGFDVEKVLKKSTD